MQSDVNVRLSGRPAQNIAALPRVIDVCFQNQQIIRAFCGVALDAKTVYSSYRVSVECLTVALHERDAYTRFHCDRVVELAVELGRHFGLKTEVLNSLCIAALFHDIGKIGVPDNVLLKPGRLTDEDWVFMKTHSALGEELFMATGHACARQVAPIIRHHHESFDGCGYPDGLKSEEIPLPCRILLIADGYDAMTNSRPYHNARSHKTVMNTLESEVGTKLDPTVFLEFSRIIERSPARSQ
ncbi:MAG: HD-GYP domain-containing protein [Rhodanobacter sp.]